MRELLRRAWRAIRQRQGDADLAEEMEFHRAMTERDLRARGLDETEASFAARRTFGSGALARDRARDIWVPPALQGLGQDLRLAVRTLWASRLVSIIAILSLALGIGANTAIFSLVDSLMLRALPVRSPAQLALLVDAGSVARVPMKVSYGIWEQLRGRPQLFAGAVAWASVSLHLTGAADAPPVDGLFTNGSFFDVLGVPAILGRSLSERDDGSIPAYAAAAPVAVISYGFWQRHYGGTADAIGRTLSLDGVPFAIVGVTPPGFFGVEVGRSFDVAVPLGAEALIHGRENGITGSNPNDTPEVMVRLKPEQTVEDATAVLRSIQPQIREATMPADWPAQFQSQYLKDPLTLVSANGGNWNVRRTYHRPLLTILAVVALVLLIACANIANLLLARATARRHELAIRRALGGSRWRLLRQLLSESVVLAAGGAALGLVVASWGSQLLVRQISTDANPVFLALSLDTRVIAFTIAMVAAAVLIFGAAPAFSASGAVPTNALKTDGGTTAIDTRGPLPSALLVAQVALSLLLVVMSGLFLRTFSSLSTRDLGFDPDRVLVVNLHEQGAAVTPGGRVASYERARDAVAVVPGVGSAALSAQTPVVTGPMLAQPIEEVSGGPKLPPRGQLSTVNLISPGWFGTIGMHVVEGRDLADYDRRNTPAVAVVNQAFARKFLGGASPIGHTVKLALPGPTPPPVEIVGLTADAVYGSIRAPAAPTIYLPIAQLPDVVLPFLSSINLIVRSAGAPPASLIRIVADAIGAGHTDITMSFHTLSEQVDASLTQERTLAMLSVFFGGVALLLAGLGLYGMTAYAVARRRMEIGIRMALGAPPGSVVRLVIGRIVLLVAAGVLVGGILSWWASRFVSTLLYGLQPHDPATLVGAALVLGAVALIAGWLPARRAARVDPAIALRYE